MNGRPFGAWLGGHLHDLLDLQGRGCGGEAESQGTEPHHDREGCSRKENPATASGASRSGGCGLALEPLDDETATELPEAMTVATSLITAERPESLSRFSRRRSASRSAAVW